MRWIFPIALLALSGCSWIGRTADSIGSYMPVIGERCEHWQCMTESGQMQSDAVKAEKERQQAAQKAADKKPLTPEQNPVITFDEPSVVPAPATAAPAVP